MTFRTRVLLAFVPVVLVPLLVFGLGVRRVVRQQFTSQYEGRVKTMVQVIAHDVTRESQAIAERLAGVREAAQADNRLRVAAVQGALAQRSYLLDYAATAMRTAGLDMLQLQDETGRILSSGHFRNEFDRLEPGVPRNLNAVSGGRGALLRARTPEAPLLVLARIDTLRLGDRTFTLVGGRSIENVLLRAARTDSSGTGLHVSLITPDDTSSSLSSSFDQSSDQLADELELPYVGESGLSAAQITVSHSLAPLAALHRGMDVWFLAAVLVSIGAAVLLAGWLASRITRPLADLSTQAERLDLEGPAVQFDGDRPDEIGLLARVLRAMAERVRAGAARLREFERRAAMGDLARQVNHDVKNGLAPLRNVLRHLAQVATESPGDLPRVFTERQATLQASVSYLEKLAANYAQLSPDIQSSAVDVNGVVGETQRNLVVPPGVSIVTALTAEVPRARADVLVVRRILDNLVRNAIESLDGGAGTVTVATHGNGNGVRITVADTGRGMTKAELDRAFDDFFTSKPGGTGLGLSIVRRLVTDLEGRLRVETEPGVGTRFIVELPSDSS
jgi:signal transduction histidine kinase